VTPANKHNSATFPPPAILFKSDFNRIFHAPRLRVHRPTTPVTASPATDALAPMMESRVLPVGPVMGQLCFLRMVWKPFPLHSLDSVLNVDLRKYRHPRADPYTSTPRILCGKGGGRYESHHGSYGNTVLPSTSLLMKANTKADVDWRRICE
jgi:hypothetical protein